LPASSVQLLFTSILYNLVGDHCVVFLEVTRWACHASRRVANHGLASFLEGYQMNDAKSISFGVSPQIGRMFLLVSIGVMVTCCESSVFGQEAKRLRGVDVGGADQRNSVEAIAFSPDGKTLACADGKQQIHLFSIAKRKLVQTCREPYDFRPSSFYKLHYLPDGKTIIAQRSRFAVAWNPRTGAKLGELQVSEETIYPLAIGPKGDVIVVIENAQAAAVRGNGSASVWSLKEGKRLRQVQIKLTKDVINDKAIFNANGVFFGPDGKVLHVVGLNQHIRLNSTDLSMISAKRRSSSASHSAVSNDRKKILMVGPQATIRHLDVSSGKSWEAKIADSLLITRIACSPDGSLLAIGGSQEEKPYLVLLNAKTRKVEAILSDGHQGYIRALSFSPDGKLLAAGSVQTEVHLWDVSAWSEAPAGGSPEKKPDLVKLETKSEMLRTWTSADGKFTLRAKLLEHDAKNVRLRKQRGGEITVPRKKLSAKDLAYLRSLSKSQK
jgi:WD40 repeat protein